MKIVFIIKEKRVSLEAVMQGLTNSSYKRELTVVFACEKKNAVVTEFEACAKYEIPAYLITYPQGTTADEMLDNTLRALTPGNVIIVRDECENYTSARLDMLIAESKAGGKVVMLREKRKNKRVVRWIKRSLSKLCGRLFGFEFYAGDIGMMYFDEKYAYMLARFNGVSLSKINRFALTDVRYINQEITDTKITDRRLIRRAAVKAAIYGAITALTLAGSVVLGVLVAVPVVFWVLIILLLAALGILALYCLLKLYITIAVGGLVRHRVEYVQCAGALQ